MGGACVCWEGGGIKRVPFAWQLRDWCWVSPTAWQRRAFLQGSFPPHKRPGACSALSRVDWQPRAQAGKALLLLKVPHALQLQAEPLERLLAPPPPA